MSSALNNYFSLSNSPSPPLTLEGKGTVPLSKGTVPLGSQRDCPLLCLQR